MKLRDHIISSSFWSIFIYVVSNSILLAAVTFVSAILIDLDHFIDYFYTVGKFKIDIKDFFYLCENFLLKKAFLVLHSFEIIFLALLLNIFIKSEILLGISLGFSFHFAQDIFFNLLYNKVRFINYFLIYRGVVLKFDFNKVFVLDKN